MAKRPEKGRARFGEVVHERIPRFLGSAKVATEHIPADDLAALASVLGLDAGEKLLYAAGSREDDALVVTGDKVSVVALAGAPSCRLIVDRLRGRVVILEQVLLSTMERLGFAHVKVRALAALSVDKVVDVAFGSGDKAEEPSVRATLSSYVAEAGKRSSGLLRTT